MSTMMPPVTLPFDYSVFKALLLVVALPPVPMLLLAAWGGWRLKRGRRWGGWLLALALAGVWLSSTEALGELLGRAIGQPVVLTPAQVSALTGRTDSVVLVLGGGVTRDVPEYGAGAPTQLTARRLAYGVWIARRSGLPLAFTGGIGWAATGQLQSEAHVVARVAAEDYGLPLRWAEVNSRDTRENAAHTLPMLAAAGVRQVVLVTHAQHMRRALRAFEAAAAPLGMGIVPAPVGRNAGGLSRFNDWCPSTTGFEQVRYVIYETMGWWAGR
jgi:uncharacterized SAM-binding protein YcdF (DUF218 family)